MHGLTIAVTEGGGLSNHFQMTGEENKRKKISYPPKKKDNLDTQNVIKYFWSLP